jgi:hypothetical protein
VKVREAKEVLSGSGYEGWGRVNGEGGGQIWWMYFLFVFEKRKMKFVEIVLSGEMRVNDGSSEPN